MTRKDLVFILDDDPVFTDVLRFFLELQGFTNVQCYSNGKEYLNNLYQLPKLVLMDYVVGDVDGKHLLEETLSFDSDIIAVVISSQQDIETAVETMRLGAFDYLAKDDLLKPRLEKLFGVIETLSIKVENIKKRKRKRFVAMLSASVIIGAVLMLDKYFMH